MSFYEEKLVIHPSYCEKTIVLCFWTKANYSRFSCLSNEIWNQATFLCLLLTACKLSNKSKQRLLRYCTLIFLMYCRIASVTSYLSESEAKNLQNDAVHLVQVADFGWNGISPEPLGALRSVMAIFFAFFTLFHLSLSFPLTWARTRSSTSEDYNRKSYVHVICLLERSYIFEKSAGVWHGIGFIRHRIRILKVARNST